MLKETPFRVSAGSLIRISRWKTRTQQEPARVPAGEG